MWHGPISVSIHGGRECPARPGTVDADSETGFEYHWPPERAPSSESRNAAPRDTPPTQPSSRGYQRCSHPLPAGRLSSGGP
eukprot:15445110-Alexandrium_andersonii.AAC.1